MHFINRCTWKSSQHYIIISMMTSLMRMSQKLVFHQSKCICAIKRILSITAMYVSSFMYLHIPCYCDACLNSSALLAGLKTLLNTIFRICSFGVILSHVAWRRAQPLGPSVSLKFLLETRLESESFEPLIDFLAFLGQKFWSKINKLINYLIS